VSTVTFRPRRARIVAATAAVAIVVIFTVVSFGLVGSVFGRGDQIAMIGLGVAFAAGALLFLRPKVSADAHGVRVQNVLGGFDLPWEVVRGIRFAPGESFASLQLEDDEVVTVVALQRVDGEHAQRGVRALRDRLVAHRARGGVPD
jgi:hypothetical protein